MAYIGQSIKNGTFTTLDTSSNTYNGSNTAFALGTQVGSPAQLLVSHDGVLQKPGTDYTLSTGGTAITFTTAPASGASIFIVEISGAVGGPLGSDLNGSELILDADGDTSLHASTDDQIDVKIAGADDFAFKANKFEVQTGSNVDMNGTELILDADGDTSLHASTDDQIDVKIAGADDFNFTANKFNTLTGSSQSFADSAKGLFGTGDDLEIYHDGTNSLIANKTGTLKVATETSGVPITLGHTTSLVTVADNVSVTGDIFLGTTSATNSAKMTSLFSRISHIGFVSENNGGNDDTEHFRFKNGNGTIGNIVAGNSATAYNTSSDYRLKENVDYTFDATTRLKQLKPARFNFITDETNTLVDGFLAHEVSSVVPEAIYGDKDGLEKNIDGTNALDADGNTIPKYQGIDQSKLVPLLVKTIQELEARITALES